MLALKVQADHLARLVLEGIDEDRVLALKTPPEKFLGKRIFDPLLDRPSKWSCAVIEVRTLLDDEFFGFIGQLDFKATIPKSVSDLGQLVVDHLLEVLVVQVPEDDHIIESVEELGSEHPFDRIHDAGLHAVVRSVIGRFLESKGLFVLDRLGSRIGRQDQDGIPEVDIAAETIGQSALFHDLEEHVEDVGVRFFDFIEQNDRVRSSADLLGQLTTFLVSNVSRRSTDQTADVVLFHVLAHVDMDQSVGVTEQAFGEGFG